jgi:putative ABC transport system permease protein
MELLNPIKKIGFMFDLDKWQEIFNSIRRHKLRTALTALGVIWGIFMLVILLGAGRGLHNGVSYQFRDDAVNSIWIRPGTTSLSYKGLQDGRRIQLNNEDIEFLDSQFEDIENLTGRFYLSGSITTKYKNKILSFNTRAVHPGHKVLENTIIIEGRYLHQKDIDEFSKVAVIGRTVKENLFEGDDPIGKEINLGGVIYKVVGVFRDTGGEWEMRNIYIPITTAQKVYAGTDRVHQIMFTGGDLDLKGMQNLRNEIHAAFSARKQFDPKDRRALRVFNLAEEYEEINGLFRVINLIVWTVGIFSIISGVIGVSNIMLIIVKDRTKEIGIRKAIGATPNSIVLMILQESIFLTAIAGYIGLVLGIGTLAALSGMETEYFRNPNVNIWIAVAATIILVISGALAGLIPAIKAARINPVQAMKD